MLLLLSSTIVSNANRGGGYPFHHRMASDDGLRREKRMTKINEYRSHRIIQTANVFTITRTITPHGHSMRACMRKTQQIEDAGEGGGTFEQSSLISEC